MVRIPLLVLALPLIAGLATAAQASGSPDPSRVLLTQQQAILVAPGEAIAGWKVERAAWSPSGEYVLATRSQFALRFPATEVSDFRQSLVLWNGREHRSGEIWKVTGAPTTPPQFEWLTAGDVAYALAQYRPAQSPKQQEPPVPLEVRQWLLRIDARRGAMKPLFSLPETASLHVSPRDPLAVVFSDVDRLIRVLRADGTVIRQAPFPEGVNLVLPRWSNDGSRFLVTSHVTSQVKNRQDLAEKQLDFELDLQTGQLVRRPTREEPLLQDTPGRGEGELRLRQTSSVVQEGGVRKQISPLWLETTAKNTPSRALIAPDADWARLSPRGDAALYLSDGSAFVVPLVSLPREAYLQAREAAMRTVALSNGRQLGLATLVYAQEHDEQLPGADQPVAQLLQQYAKPAALYEGFVYTFPGGKLADVSEPAKTVLGYVLGPGGRAEIFVDGHVVWKKDE